MESVLTADLDLARQNTKTLIAYESRIKQLEGELRQKVDTEASQATELGNANDGVALTNAQTHIAALKAEIATWQGVKERVEGWYLDLKRREGAVEQGRRDLEERTRSLKGDVEEHRQRIKSQIFEEQQADLRKGEAAMKESQLEMDNATETRTKTLEAMHTELQKAQSVLEQQMGEEFQQRVRILDARDVELQARETAAEGYRQSLEKEKEELGQRAETLANLQIKLRAKESDVENKMERLGQETQERHVEFQRKESSFVTYLEQRMATFQQSVEEVLLQNEAEAESLRARIREVSTEKDELQLELRAMQTRAADAESAFSVELDQRRRAEKVRNLGLYPSLYTRDIQERDTIQDERKKSFINSTATQRDLQMKLADAEARLATLEAERVRLRDEMETSRARHPAAGEPAQGTELGGKQRVHIGMLHTQVATLQANLDDANRRLIEQKGEKRAVEGILATKDLELRSQREKSDALKEKLSSAKEEVAALDIDNAKLDSENRNLRETHKQHRVQISELKRKISQHEQSVIKAKAETLKVRQTAYETKVEQDHRYDALQSYAIYVTHSQDYSELQNFYEEQTKAIAERDTALVQRDTTLAQEIQKLQPLTKENGELKETVAKLQTMNKNLQSSVLRAGAEAKQELQKKANTEQQNFEVNIQVLHTQNAELQRELDSLRTRLAELRTETDAERRCYEVTMKIRQRKYDTNMEAFEKEHAKLQEVGIQSANVANVENDFQELRSLRTRLADTVRERDDPRRSLRTLQSLINNGFEETRRLSEPGPVSRIQLLSGCVLTRVSSLIVRLDILIKATVTRTQIAEPMHESDNNPQSEERALYTEYMKDKFPLPASQPTLNDLEPIHKTAGAHSLDIFIGNNIRRQRRGLHCPKRSFWCGPGPHVLVFAATREYGKHGGDASRMVLNCGQEFDFFMTEGDMVYYVGIYQVLSLREVHPPGAEIPIDVSRAAIVRGMGIYPGPEGKVNEKIKDCYPDGEIRTECFGLRCVGFDRKLYESLRECFLSGAGAKKRKADSEDLRNERKKGKRKMQKCWWLLDYSSSRRADAPSARIISQRTALNWSRIFCPTFLTH
ncbi:hypothetical protein B0H19DRAFT_1084666 [Mycena capillaripes]|nr:hypothetical protein B0H19DRAFT_1084666 [Mycena capillaripes]